MDLLLRRRSSAGRHIHHHQRFKEQYTLDTLSIGTHFTKREIQSIYRGFKQHCPSGVLGSDTLKEIYCQLFPQGNPTTYAHLVFKTLDQNDFRLFKFWSKLLLNFFILWAIFEYLLMLSSMSRGSINEKLHWIFNLYDVDRDGYVTMRDMLELVSAVYDMMHHCTRTSRASAAISKDKEVILHEHVQRFFKKFDPDEDGIITRDKFMEKCLKDENIIKSLAVLDTVM
ncbi:Kv channel-interacting protein 4 [Nymphon striatum]|nr:Kv channel-interacting protein 4 [Nymphon striatum]